MAEAGAELASNADLHPTHHPQLDHYRCGNQYGTSSGLWEALTVDDGEEADAVRGVFAWSYRALPEPAARLAWQRSRRTPHTVRVDVLSLVNTPGFLLPRQPNQVKVKTNLQDGTPGDPLGDIYARGYVPCFRRSHLGTGTSCYTSFPTTHQMPTNTAMTAWEHFRSPAHVSSRRLDQLTVQAIWREDPMMVQLTDEDRDHGPLLSIGLGAVHSCADWHSSSTAARWSTDRTSSAAVVGLTRFSQGGTPRFMPSRAMISLDQAWQAMDDFWTFGLRPPRLRWRLS